MFDRMRRIVRRGAAAGLLSLALVGLAVPAASAAEPTTAPDAAAIARFAGHRHPLLRGTVRADLTVVKRDGTTILVHYERGEITAVSDSSITINGRDGQGATFVVTADTRVHEHGHRAKISDLEVGNRAMVFGTSENGTYRAILICRVARGPASAP